MDSGVSVLRILFLLDVGGAQVLATGKPPGPEIDFKYALIGTAVGIAITAGFLALKICMIRRHLFDDNSSDLRSPPGGLNDTDPLKKRAPRKLQASPLRSFRSPLQRHYCIIESLFKAKPQFLRKRGTGD
uniref:Transmembrane protein 273 n=1 Tax=Saimiri boliviensis boliviensis TaxID=39432 RepID=A0A2K6UDP6_SAIBB|nr:transmembrane protein 273 isoform X3 [Saimiri boliviensis boliviensis]